MSHIESASKDELFIELADGGRWHPERSNNEASLLAIAHSLGNLCRFTGHCANFYSVAEHSVKVSYLLPSKDALMHDAHEAICNDLSKPNKLWLSGSYEELERRCEQQIAAQYGLDWPQSEELKFYDKVMCQIEAHYLMQSRGLGKGYYPPEVREKAAMLRETRPELRPSCWSPSEATNQFIKRFYELRDVSTFDLAAGDSK